MCDNVAQRGISGRKRHGYSINFDRRHCCRGVLGSSAVQQRGLHAAATSLRIGAHDIQPSVSPAGGRAASASHVRSVSSSAAISAQDRWPAAECHYRVQVPAAQACRLQDPSSARLSAPSLRTSPMRSKRMLLLTSRSSPQPLKRFICSNTAVPPRAPAATPLWQP